MTKSLKKVLLVIVSALFLSTCGMFFTTNNATNSVNAETPTAFYMLEEAGLKTSSEGLRFRAYMDKTTGDSIKADDNKTLVFIVAPAGYFAAMENSDYKNLNGAKIQVVDESKLYEGDGGYYANVAITNIKAKNKSRAFQAIAAIVDNGEYIYAKSTPTSNEAGPCVEMDAYNAVNDAILNPEVITQDIVEVYNWFGTTLSYENDEKTVVDESFPVKVETEEEYATYVKKVITDKNNEQDKGANTLPVLVNEDILTPEAQETISQTVIEELQAEEIPNADILFEEATNEIPQMVTVTFAGDNDPVEVAVVAGSKVSARVDKLAGYEFDAWYKDGEKFDFNTEITQSITLDARYTKTLAKVEYEVYTGVTDGAPVVNATAFSHNIGSYDLLSATLNGAEFTDYAVSDGNITLNDATSACGEILFSVVTGNKTLVTPVNVVTKIIKTQADLENMFIYGGIDSNLNYGGYFVLGNNITLTSKLANRVGDVDYRAYDGTNTIENASETRDGRTPNNRNQGFTGTFDGQGYTISGLVVGLKNGNIFGNVAENGGEVKNLAVVGKFDAAEFTNSGAAGLLANQFCGKLTNCYIECRFTAATEKGAFGAIARNISNAKVTDVVIKVDKNGSTASDIFSLAYMGVDHIGWQSGAATITNVHSISAGAAVMSSGYSVNATVEENTIEHDVDVAFDFAPTSATYWDLTGDQPKFATTPVYREPIITEVEYTDVVEVYGSVVDGAPVANSLTLELDAETVDAVTVAGASVEYTYNAGLLTISAESLASYAGSSAVINITSGIDSYIYTLTNIVTKVIENQTDLENMFIYGGIDTASVGKTYGGYFVLANNIYINGALANRVAGTDYRNYVTTTDNGIEDREGKTANDGMNGFTGIFDGQGYTISGFKAVPNNGGIFGNVATTGTVKNVAVVGQFAETGVAFVFGNQVNGTVDNVYIEMSFAGTVDAGNYSGLARTTANAKLSNIVVKIDAESVPAGTVTIAYMANDWYGWGVHIPSITNVYSISNGVACGDYGNKTSITAAYGLNDTVSVTLADTSMWNLTGDQPRFITTPVITEVEYTDVVEVYDSVVDGAPVANSLTLELDAETVDAVTVAGASVEYIYNAGLLTFSVENLVSYVGSSAVINIASGFDSYIYTLTNIVTKVIENQTDLENMFIYGGLDSNLNYGGYFVLGNNIVLNGTLANRVGGTDYRAYDGTNTIENASETRDGRTPNNRNQGFTGVFDGQGYTISGLVVGLKNGNIFGNVAENGGEVKNLAVVGKFDAAEFTNGGAAGLLANQFCGKLTNCYIECRFTAATEKGSFGAIARNISNAKVTDVVIKVDKNGSTTKDIFSLAFMGVDHIGWQSGAATITNVHSISAGAAVMSSGYSVNATVEANTIEHDVDVAFDFAPTSATYWDLTGTQPKFATTPVYIEPIITEVEYNDVVEVYGSVVDGAPVANSLTLELDAETVDAVTVAGASVEYTYNAGLLTISAESLASYAGSSAVINITSGIDSYIYTLTNIVTKVIENQTDLENMFIYGGLTTKDNGVMVYGGNFVLGNNINVNGLLNNRVKDVDYNGPVGGSYHYNSDRVIDTTTYDTEIGFTGTFDGQGYSIIGLQLEGGNGGIFGNVARTGVVKNLGVTVTYLQNKASEFNGPFGDRMNGTLTNVYIEGKAGEGSTSASYSGIARNIAYAVLTDVVVKFDTTGLVATDSLGVAYMVNDWTASTANKSKPTNVYVITNAAKAGDYGASVTYNMYAIDATVSATFTDNSKWNLNGDQPKFASIPGNAEKNIALSSKYVVYNADNTVNDLSLDLNATMTSNGINTASITAIELVPERGNVISVELSALASGILTVSGSEFGVSAYGNTTVILRTADIDYKIKYVKVVTKVLTTKDEITNLATFGGATTSNYSYDGYYELGNNIDMQGSVDTWLSMPVREKLVPNEDKRDYKGFKGIFDGNGYTIYNISPAYSKDPLIFSAIETGAIVRNTGFIGWLKHFWYGNASAFLAYYNGGLIENCYIEYTIGNGQSYNDGPNSPLVYVNDGDFKDVVARIDIADAKGDSIIFAKFGADRGEFTNVTAYINNPRDIVVNAPSSITQKAYDNTDALTMTDGTFWSTEVPKFLSAVDPANFSK